MGDKKYISVSVLVSMMFSISTSFAWLDVSTFWVSDSIKSVSGTWIISSVVNAYEDDLNKKKDTKKLQSLLSEKENMRSGKFSQTLKDEILANTLSGVKLKNLRDDLKILKNANNETVALQTIIDSTKKDAKQNKYKLLVKTDLSVTELKDLLNFFDSVEINNVYGNVYEITFGKGGKLGDYLIKSIEAGTLPENLFGKVEIVKPVLVQSNGTFLNGESSTLSWGIVKIWAPNYQETLSKKAKIKVGVIDTGINITHPDLVKNIYINTGEIAGNSIDDDKNGYIDDVNGYNFIANTPQANDDHGHGSHVAWVIWASVNASGIYGVNSNASLVSLKVLSAQWYGSSYAIVNAIKYAADNGIKVVNLSLGWTGNPATDPMCSAITYAKSKWTLSIVAAWNENADVSTKVPAWCADAITVWAVDSNLNKASFSNYWAKVDVSAPWVNIYSTYLGTQYVSMNGTSMATPFVAGLTSAMLASTGVALWDVKSILSTTGDNVISSVNIGKFINMKNVMTKIGVRDDSFLGTGTTTPPSTWSGTTGTGSTGTWWTSTGNILPVLSLTWVKLSMNYYQVKATATDSDGTIAWYAFYNSGVLVYSGTANTYNIAITKDTLIKVDVIDNKWGKTSQSITLKYEAPVIANKLPVINTTYSIYQKNYFKIDNSISDTDGTIKEFQIYINDRLYYSYTNLSYKSISVSFYINKWTYNVKVVAKDNSGWVTQKVTTVK